MDPTIKSNCLLSLLIFGAAEHLLESDMPTQVPYSEEAGRLPLRVLRKGPSEMMMMTRQRKLFRLHRSGHHSESIPMELATHLFLP